MARSEESAEALLVETLVKCRALLARGEREVPGGEALIDELLARLEAGGPARAGEQGALAEWLAAFAGPDGARSEVLADVVTLVVRDLAEGDGPPSSAGGLELWLELVILTDALFGSGVAPLGRLPFVSDRLIELLAEESGGAERRVDRAGPLEPAYRAVYLYDIPGSHVEAHDYEVVFHLILDHGVPDGEEGSALVVHRVGEAEPQRVRLQPGEAVALRGRGTIHSWEPMGPDEERTLLAIGFQRADGP